MTSMNLITIRCTDCGHTTDTVDRGLIGTECMFFGPDSDPDEDSLFTGCAGTYRRVWTAPGVRFKGDGFHRNDYR